MNTNVVTADFSEKKSVISKPVYQYDYGLELHVSGVELPQTFEAHFCNVGDDETKTAIGSDYVVTIPDEFLIDGRNIFGYIFLHSAVDDGETVYKIEIRVNERAEPSDGEITPQEHSAISEAISALNTAVEHADEVAEGIPTAINDALTEAKASGMFDGKDGVDGIDGKDGKDGADGYTPVKGVDYFDGADGQDGYTPIKGTDYFDGQDGADGVSPTVSVTEITGGHSVSITDKTGSHTFSVMDGETGPQGETGADGSDYVLTIEDKAEIAGIVAGTLNAASIIKDTASGSVASFTDGAYDIPVDSLLVEIEPVQDGTGDPSPSNVRAITGWTGCTISHSGEDTSDPDMLSISWQSEAGTVYGGRLDVVTGELVVDRELVTVDAIDRVTSTSYIKSDATDGYVGIDRIYPELLPSKQNTQYSNKLAFVKAAIWSNVGYPNSFTLNNKQLHVNISNNLLGITDYTQETTTTAKDKLNAYLAQNPVTVTIPVEPITYHLTPYEIRTLLGNNNIWADTGDCSVTYSCDTKRYIDKKLSALAANRGMTLASARPSLQMGVDGNDLANDIDAEESE